MAVQILNVCEYFVYTIFICSLFTAELIKLKAMIIALLDFLRNRMGWGSTTSS